MYLDGSLPAANIHRYRLFLAYLLVRSLATGHLAKHQHDDCDQWKECHCLKKDKKVIKLFELSLTHKQAKHNDTNLVGIFHRMSSLNQVQWRRQNHRHKFAADDFCTPLHASYERSALFVNTHKKWSTSKPFALWRWILASVFWFLAFVRGNSFFSQPFNLIYFTDRRFTFWSRKHFSPCMASCYQ